MSTKIEKAYEAKKYEDRIYKIWEKSDFLPQKSSRVKTFYNCHASAECHRHSASWSCYDACH